MEWLMANWDAIIAILNSIGILILSGVKRSK